MKPRTFNSVMPRVNEKWASEILNLPQNNHPGPDLVDDNKIVEIKFKLIFPDKYTHRCWRILGHQLEYQEDKEAYWGLGTYQLDREVSSIKTKNPENLESMVVFRTLTIVPWNWMNQFKKYHQTGETEISKWDHYIIFAKARLLPKIIQEYSVSKGKVMLTKGVNPDNFNIRDCP